MRSTLLRRLAPAALALAATTSTAAAETTTLAATPPEPASLVLVTFGLVALGGALVARRRYLAPAVPVARADDTRDADAYPVDEREILALCAITG